MNVVAHDMEEWSFIPLHLAANQFVHQSAGKAAALKVRMGADTADLPVRTSIKPFAAHGEQAIAFEKGEVVPQFDGSQAERTRTGESGQFKSLGRVLGVKLNCSVGIVRGHGAFP